MRVWIATRKAEYLADKVCALCGRNKHLALLSRPGLRYNRNCWSWTKVFRDLELCKAWVLCADCKRVELQRRRRGPLRHGTESGYGYGCHCGACKEAHAQANRERRARRKQRAESPH